MKVNKYETTTKGKGQKFICLYLSRLQNDRTNYKEMKQLVGPASPLDLKVRRLRETSTKCLPPIES